MVVVGGGGGVAAGGRPSQTFSLSLPVQESLSVAGLGTRATARNAAEIGGNSWNRWMLQLRTTDVAIEIGVLRFTTQRE